LPVCSDCAKGIIQVGIKKVVVPRMKIQDPWKESWQRSVQMFDEADVKWSMIDYE
jgi:dCMP deaminase